MSTLIIGYGNFDREDDGVAWHVLTALAQRLGYDTPDAPEEGLEPEGKPVDFLFRLQLTPEIAETLAEYDRACFVDAHTGAVPEDLHVETLSAQFQVSPFTHHMTPETSLSIAETLYGKRPDAILVSVRGYGFGFSRSLSPETAALAEQAVEVIWKWLKEK